MRSIHMVLFPFCTVRGGRLWVDSKEETEIVRFFDQGFQWRLGFGYLFACPACGSCRAPGSAPLRSPATPTSTPPAKRAPFHFPKSLNKQSRKQPRSTTGLPQVRSTESGPKPTQQLTAQGGCPVRPGSWLFWVPIWCQFQSPSLALGLMRSIHMVLFPFCTVRGGRLWVDSKEETEIVRFFDQGFQWRLGFGYLFGASSSSCLSSLRFSSWESSKVDRTLAILVHSPLFVQ